MTKKLEEAIECTVTVIEVTNADGTTSVKTLTELGITAYSNDDIGFVRIAVCTCGSGRLGHWGQFQFFSLYGAVIG